MKQFIAIIVVFIISAACVIFTRNSFNAPAPTSTTQPVTIMTAASAGNVMVEIADKFKEETGGRVIIVTGGSNALASQIISGAPADLFLSASADWANNVIEKGLTANSRSLLTNDLVLVVPKDNPGSVNSLADLVGDKVRKIALAGDNVPCGKYARQAFESLKIYDALINQFKIVRGQDVRAALNFIERAEVEAGVVYSTDAIFSSKVKVIYKFDSKDFDPIVYPLVLLKQGEKNPSAVKFQAYLAGDNSRKIFEKYGFSLIDAPSRGN
jgi:molybdate transport system substrate-binding protein